MDVQIGTLACPGSTGTQDITHSVSNLKALIFFGGYGTTEGDNADAYQFFGIDDGTRHYCDDAWLDDAYVFGTSGARMNHSNTNSILARTNTGLLMAAYVSAITSTTFTLTWSTVSSGAIVNWIAIGGSEISAYAGDLTWNTTLGDQPETGVGFQGEGGIFLTPGRTAFDSVGLNFKTCFGAAKSATERFAYQGWAEDNVNPSDATTIYRNDACCVMGTNSITGRMDFKSWDADGFTLTVDDAPIAAWKMSYLILKGAAVSLGSFDQPTDTGQQTIDGSLGMDPLLTMFVSRGDTSAAADVTNDLKVSIGAGRDASEEGVSWTGALEGETTNTVSDHYFASTRCISLKEAGTPTLKADAQYLDQVSGSLKIDWLTVDATQRQVDYLVLGIAAEPAGIVPFRRRIEGY